MDCGDVEQKIYFVLVDCVDRDRLVCRRVGVVMRCQNRDIKIVQFSPLI